MNALSKTWDIPILLLLSLVWASSYTAIKIAVPEVGPIGVVFLRCMIGALLMLGIISMMARRCVWPKTFREWAILAVVSVMSSALPFYLISYAEQEISSSLTAILMATGPLAVIVLGHFFTEDEKINRGKLIGVGVGFGAAIYLLRAGLGEFDGAGIGHPMAVIGAAVCYAIGGLMAKRLIKVSVEVIATIVLTVSAAVMLPFYITADMPSLSALDTNVVLAIIWLGVMSSGLGFYLRYLLIKRSGYGFVSYVGYLVPLFTIGIGMIVLKEQVRPDTIMAMVLILMGLLITRNADDAPWSLNPHMKAFRQKVN